MEITFTVNDAACCLEACIDGQAYPLVTPRLIHLVEREWALGYLRGVADRLNACQSAGRTDEMSALLTRQVTTSPE
jgi:hypothetical protein